ncbi:hypothetical protein TBLA_0C03790 [Henningerozyma blattae CBS 6284]|uniref:Uncharacterized protein n=1 Tax=Henningerozyma blattae (strain ATCC 34711 / CBS 6284 / DSM 70876 / NBRC 10599 / NRRL Y-10934 / UCD 77-7) TaxID=1071380 RepID=I2H1C9_HENB6|nr:hypothetical protein TBLA_0C03790 [Tetrapisispora blattae CBS 6284]CCH60181.1 hypothetical protein TBLA_0C03790 [Tetrapisispora blattae CBS 6284]
MSKILQQNLHAAKDGISDPFLNYVLDSKIEMNLRRLKETIIENQLNSKQFTSSATNLNSNRLQVTDAKSISDYQRNFNKLSFEIQKDKNEVYNQMQKHYEAQQKNTKTRRYSIDFDTAIDLNEVKPELLTDLDDSIRYREDMVNMSSGSFPNDTDGMAELRKRLLGNKDLTDGNGINNTTLDKQIKDQDNIQNNLVEDMTRLVGALKQGATAFQNALEEDTNVLGAAELGVQATQRGLGDISTKLSSYDKQKLGYMFFILTLLFMFIGLIVVYIIIKIFPAL